MRGPSQPPFGGLEGHPSPRAADTTWDYKKVKWDSIGMTEKWLGLQRDSEKKGTKLFGIL